MAPVLPPLQDAGDDGVEDGGLIAGVVDGFGAGEVGGGFGREFNGDGGAGEIVQRLEECAAHDDGDCGVFECGVDVGGEADALVHVTGLRRGPGGCG